MILLFLSSGLFLGWSLGANDAANVFGSAVGSRMLKFTTAAIICSIFIILGAVFQGQGAAETLDELGSIENITASFAVALSAAITVTIMTRYTIPVSTSQAIVGAIIGYNVFAGQATDFAVLSKIVVSWIAGPVLGAFFSFALYLLVRWLINKCTINLFRLDLLIKILLIAVGAFGSFSLGANNIANVMGVFVLAIHLPDMEIMGISFNGAQQLFFIGGVAISLGVITYSRRLMYQVGHKLLNLNSMAAIVVVLAHAIVLFIFSSQSLGEFLVSLGLPAIPLVPVSSSQVIVGAIIGIGILNGGRGIKYRIIGQIGLGWVLTPVVTAVISLLILFVSNNILPA